MTFTNNINAYKTFMKTFRFIAAALAAIFGLSVASAQILYKVEKPGSDKVSYVLGSHHLAPLAVIDSISELPSIMKGIDAFYGEIDMEQMATPEAMMAMQAKAVVPADSTLDKVLSPAQLDSLNTVWNSLTGGAAPLTMMYGVKPAIISTQIAAILVQKDFPQLNPLEGIDITMQARAKELSKPVLGLETMDFQMDMLYGRPISEQAKELMETVADIEKEEKQSAELSKAYLSHDLKKILTLMEEDEDDKDSLERMIYSRNDNWVEQLTKKMPEKSLMIVVGAGHLPGERGILKGFEKAGFTVTPLK